MSAETACVTRLAVLGSAIAARRLVISPVPGQRAYTDGTVIVVGTDTDATDLRDAVVVQAALLACGSLRKDLMARLSRCRPAVAERYLSMELARAGARLGHLMPSATAARLETSGIACVSADAEESFELAVGGTTVAPAPLWAGTIRPALLRRAAEVDLTAAPSDADATRLGDLPADQPQPSADPEHESDEESKIVNLLSAPGMSNPLGEALQKLLGMGRRAAQSNQGGAEIPVERQRFAAVGRNARRLSFARLDRTVPVAPAPAPGFEFRYPEWDCHRSDYRAGWCAVAEFDPAEREHDQDVHVAGDAGAALRRPLARVGVEAQRHRRQPDGDGLDMSALVDYAVQRTLGQDPEPTVYESTRLTKRDLSVLVLLDCSGSTAENSGARTVFDEERELAGALTAALERLGDRVGTFGFYSRGRNALTFLRIKDFGARLDGAAKRRLAAVRPSGFTRIGAAIRHATHVLESQALAKNMVLVVVGDGLPYDEGYEDRYARSDARQAIEEATHRGIGVVGLGIRSSTAPEVLEEVWSIAPFRVVADVADVAGHLRGLLQIALNVTRTNGRRRDLRAAEHRMHLRSAAALAGRRNSYV